MGKPKDKSTPEKSQARVSINISMVGVLFVILTLIWTLGPQEFSPLILAQLIFAIPLLFISSLFYAKLGYRKDISLYNKFGWITATLGNIFTLNVIGLMAKSISRAIASMYFTLVFLCIFLYYLTNVYYDRKTLKEELLKVIFIFIILLVGGILPFMK